jgi:hypothetical protein
VVTTIFISLNKFNEGGDAILNINSKKSHNLILGIEKARPLLI